jgi:hypothetical protein
MLCFGDGTRRKNIEQKRHVDKFQHSYGEEQSHIEFCHHY